MTFRDTDLQHQEAETRLIEMHDDDGDALHSLLEYLYTGDYVYNSDYDSAAQATAPTSLDRMQSVQRARRNLCLGGEVRRFRLGTFGPKSCQKSGREDLIRHILGSALALHEQEVGYLDTLPV